MIEIILNTFREFPSFCNHVWGICPSSHKMLHINYDNTINRVRVEKISFQTSKQLLHTLYIHKYSDLPLKWINLKRSTPPPNIWSNFQENLLEYVETTSFYIVYYYNWLLCTISSNFYIYLWCT